MWVLQHANASNERLILRVAPGATKTLGRAPEADLILDAALVSRVHCRLEAELERVSVIDLSSTNGTYINDARIERGSVSDGDRLRVGRVEFTVKRFD